MRSCFSLCSAGKLVQEMFVGDLHVQRNRSGGCRKVGVPRVIYLKLSKC